MKSHSINELSITAQGNELVINGPLTHETVVSALDTCVSLLGTNQNVIVNLQSVSDCDSSSLAFIVELMRECQKQKRALGFSHIPPQMRDLSIVSGLAGLIPLES